MEVDCNGIKRKPPLDWDHLLLTDSDDDRPPDLVVKSDHEITENQMMDVLMMKSDRELTETVARFRKALQSLGDRLPDKGEKVKENLRRHEQELERRKKLQSEKADKGCEETIQLSDHSDDGRKLKSKSQTLGKGRSQMGLSSSRSPKTSNDDNKDGDYTTSLSEPNSPQDPPSRNLRPRSRRTYHLVDVDPLMQKFRASLDPCMKDVTVYYPSRDDPNAVEVNYADMECLAPEACISFTIMNFYIRCLQQPSSLSESAICNYHFFNTYFYNKLEKLSYKEDSFLKFRKWWKGVNIFEKAYILLPIHENAHWSLVIICLPNKEDELGPILLHLDSLGLHNSQSLFDNIIRFLKEEWSHLRKSESHVNLPVLSEIWENLDHRVDHRTVMVPQQKNDYDCGLFVLFYMERFIKEAPERFNKKDSSMFSRQWFRPREASKLRGKIYDLLVEQFKKAKEC
ncbi:hypothetical protein L1987_69033 [Smallanthus sonchifolius]|uniref:Uncharacterized protein n=1 Tax=Smallanthus sonchifolius TaxID=185202 RepID=A0ACB9B4M0_9ASTR|nr:hypothetical protein L1987_69033 [Smallanthus sonchifolius]